MVKLTFDPAMEVTQECVRRRFRFASCQACADVCPAQALTSSQMGILTDATRCIQCGNCLFVCPTNAIAGVTPNTRHYCGDTLVGPFSSYAPTVNELLIWHREYGIRFIAIALEQYESWALSIARLNLVLKQCGEPIWRVKSPEAKAINIARRSLFHVPQANVETATARPGLRYLRQLFGEQSEITPTIDSSLCVMCSACWRACPEKAIRFENGEIILESARCTGCGSCEAVCQHRSMTLDKTRSAAQIKRITANARECLSCHREFWAFDAQASHCSLCQNHLYGMRC